MAFRCVVVTPEEQTLDDQVTQVILPASDGLIGILTGRSPLLAKLGVGPLRVDLAGGQRRTWFIDGGVAQMKGNQLTVLTTEATPPEEIDVEAARAEYAEAQARVATDTKTREDRQRAMDRGRMKQQVAQKR